LRPLTGPRSDGGRRIWLASAIRPPRRSRAASPPSPLLCSSRRPARTSPPTSRAFY